MRRAALLLLAALPLSGCPQETQAELPPAGLAGNGTAPGSAHGAVGPSGAPAAPVAAASQPAAPHAGATAPHPSMGTQQPAAASQPATPTVIPGGGSEQAAAAAELTGTVAEAHHVKEYTYVRVKDQNGNESWAAILKDETINVGTKLSLGKDVWMTDFQSPSLGKTFDRILFGRVLSKQ